MQRIAALCLACLLAAMAAAGEAAKTKKKQKTEFEHLEVWAERIVYQGKTGKFTFTGNVTVIKDDLRVDCDDMEGSVDPKSRQLTKVTAVGNVRMLTVGSVTPDPKGGPPKTTAAAPDAWRATCAKADYDLKVGRLVLSGKTDGARPRLWRAKGYGEADKIIFVPSKGEYELIGDPVIRGEVPTGPIAKPPKHKPPAARP